MLACLDASSDGTIACVAASCDSCRSTSRSVPSPASARTLASSSESACTRMLFAAISSRRCVPRSSP